MAGRVFLVHTPPAAPGRSVRGHALIPRGALRGSPHFSPGRHCGRCDVEPLRVFIDFWNFTLSWERWDKETGDPTKPFPQQKCDWRALPVELVKAAGKELASVGVDHGLQLEETMVYASVDPVGEAKLRDWLITFVNRLPSFDVKTRDRAPRSKAIHCRLCRTTTSRCPNCGEVYVGKPEKGVDAAIVTDLLSLAWQGAYDVAVLVSSDADFIPAIEHVQAKGLKVINASWRNRGHDLQRACWASFHIDGIAEELCR